MVIEIFDGELRMGYGKNATMVFAQDFRLEQCALQKKKLYVLCEGVEILGAEEHREISSHPVYFDHTLIGRLSGNSGEFSVLPEAGAGPHRVTIQVSPFPGTGLCDDFVLKSVTFACE
jgi:hypothetical protein